MRAWAALAALVVAASGCLSPSLTTAMAPPPRVRGPEPVLHFEWRRELTEHPTFTLDLEYHPQEFASAATDGEHVFVGTIGGHFYALSRDGSAILWQHDVEGGVAAPALYLPDFKGTDELAARRNGTVYVGGNDGILHAWAAADGHERWKYVTQGPIHSVPVYDDGNLYFFNGENRVYCLDAATGAWKWQYDRESPDSFTIRGTSAPLVYGGRVYAGFSDGYLATLNAKSGDVIWARNLAGDAQRFLDVDATPSIVDGVLYASSYSGGVWALDPADGSTRWRYEVEGAGTPVVSGARIFFSAPRDGLTCLDLAGHLLWRQSLEGRGEISRPVLLAGGTLLVVSAADGGTYVVDAAGGALLQGFDPGGGVTAPPATDGHNVWVLTNGGYFYAFSLARS